MSTGKIRYVKSGGDFAFIAPDAANGAADIFFHESRFNGDWPPTIGQRVEFSEDHDRQGRLRAIAVTPLEQSPAPAPKWTERSRADDLWWTK